MQAPEPPCVHLHPWQICLPMPMRWCASLLPLCGPVRSWGMCVQAVSPVPLHAHVGTYATCMPPSVAYRDPAPPTPSFTSSIRHGFTPSANQRLYVSAWHCRLCAHSLALGAISYVLRMALAFHQARPLKRGHNTPPPLQNNTRRVRRRTQPFEEGSTKQSRRQVYQPLSRHPFCDRALCDVGDCRRSYSIT